MKACRHPERMEITQPRVARNELPWDQGSNSRYPERVASGPRASLGGAGKIPPVGNVALCALLALLSGCALSKPPTHSQVLTNALPQGTTIPGGWNSTATTNPIASDWLKSFHDARLDAIVAEAITNNLDLRQAAARVEMARQNVVVVASQMTPKIGANFRLATARDDAHDQWYNSQHALAGVAWEPDVWGRLRAQRAAAQAGYQATALDYAYARQSLAATAARSWYLTIETSQLVALTEQSVVIYSNLLDLVKIRRAAGKVSDLDVSEAGANLNASENDLRSAQGLASQARRDLEVLIGRYPSAELKVVENFAPLPPPVQPGLPSSLLERRPDIVAAEQQVLVAFREQEVAKLALLPTFTLNLDGGKLSDNLLSVLRLNPWMVSAAVGMYVPIYTGGALRAQIKIATAQQQEAVAGYGSIALRAFREVENGLTNEQLLAQRLHTIYQRKLEQV